MNRTAICVRRSIMWRDIYSVKIRYLAIVPNELNAVSRIDFTGTEITHVNTHFSCLINGLINSKNVYYFYGRALTWELCVEKKHISTVNRTRARIVPNCGCRWRCALVKWINWKRTLKTNFIHTFYFKAKSENGKKKTVHAFGIFN